ncbi:MAG: cytochrome c-type biogenesis protein CcmH [Solirubrobacteraceae bacterium]
MRSRAATVATTVAVTLAGFATLVLSLPPTAGAVMPRVSLTEIENDVMCVSCHEPLAVAQSPQSYAERNFIRGLIAQGQTKSQIEHALVGQYTVAVLALPPAHGFNLTVYILPPAILIAGLATLAVALPRWRRRTRAAAARLEGGSGRGLSTADAQRLDGDLARFDG